MEPQNNAGPWDWQNMFVITTFVNLYRGSFSYCLMFTITGVEKNSWLDRGLNYRGSTVIDIFI